MNGEFGCRKLDEGHVIEEIDVCLRGAMFLNF